MICGLHCRASKQLFYNTGIPACIWFISRKRAGNGDCKRTGRFCLLMPLKWAFMADRTHREFSDEDIAKISGTYHEGAGETAI